MAERNSTALTVGAEAVAVDSSIILYAKALTFRNDINNITVKMVFI